MHKARSPDQCLVWSGTSESELTLTISLYAHPIFPVKQTEAWTVHKDPNSGTTYFFNRISLESQWERPAGLASDAVPDVQTSDTEARLEENAPQAGSPSEKHEDWLALVDGESGHTYYYNQWTDVTQWEKPVDVAGLTLHDAISPDRSNQASVEHNHESVEQMSRYEHPSNPRVLENIPTSGPSEIIKSAIDHIFTEVCIGNVILEISGFSAVANHRVHKLCSSLVYLKIQVSRRAENTSVRSWGRASADESRTSSMHRPSACQTQHHFIASTKCKNELFNLYA